MENETKKQMRRFFGMLLGRLGAGLLGNMLADNSVIWAGNGVHRAG